MWIKICGTTNLEDAEMAVNAGATALGFVFAPGPRRIGLDTARQIGAHLPATIQRVGVFVNEKPARVREIVDAAGLTAVQLHGDETPEYVRQLFRDAEAPLPGRVARERKRPTRIFKAVRMDAGAAAALRQWSAPAELVDAILLDADASLRGGSGEAFDWDAAALLLQPFAGKTRFIAAGGLRPENVATAIAKLRPWGVDVASGVERQPGRKDEALVRAFIANATRVIA